MSRRVVLGRREHPDVIATRDACWRLSVVLHSRRILKLRWHFLLALFRKRLDRSDVLEELLLRKRPVHYRRRDKTRLVSSGEWLRRQRPRRVLFARDMREVNR